MARHRTAAALLLALFVVAAALPTPALSQDASGIDLSSIPASCLAPAAQFQTECAGELESAQAALGLTSSGASNASAEAATAAVDEYARTAPPPSPACCTASCQFNNQGCVCSPGVVQVAATFLTGSGGNEGPGANATAANAANATAGAEVLLSVARAFHGACARAAVSYPLYAGAAGCAAAPTPGTPQAEAAVATCGGAAAPGGAAAAPAPAAAAAAPAAAAPATGAAAGATPAAVPGA
jgi:hypothetical protein